VDANAFAAAVATQRGYLMRIATLQLRDRASAEDAVQEALVAAFAGREGFDGRSSLRTWLTSILKHKVVDAIRRRQREPLFESSLSEEVDVDDFDGLFRDNGAWDAPPASWGDPEASLGQRQFFDVLELCLERLPPNTARVFVMREVMELDSEEICKELSITTNNLWVILYRARMSLRECLQQRWFGDAARPT
jgi:RNA polymerase sigma-70 factor (ECF subfamily)